MRLNLITLLIVTTGAFFYWSVSGYKGSFNDHISRYYEIDLKYDKNYWTGLALLFFIATLIIAILE